MAEEAKPKAWYRRIPPALIGLVLLLVGMVLGTFAPEQVGFIGDGVKAAFRGLAKAAPYIIFFTIAAAVGDMMGAGKAGRLAFWVTLTFTMLGILAGAVAIILSVPIFGLSLGFEGGGGRELLSTLGEQALLILHSSQAFIAVLYAAFVAILLGYGAKWRRTAWFCAPTRDVIRRVGVDGINLVGRVLKVAFPYLLLGLGIFIPGAIADAVDKTTAGVGAAAQLSTPIGGSPVAIYFTNVAIQVMLLAVYISIVIAVALAISRFPAKRFFKDYFFFTYTFAWATASSAASIPVTLERTGNGLKVRKEIRDFVVPLGATMNLDGAMVACFTITVLASMIVGYKPTMLDLILLLIPLKIATMGVPGIPGGIATVVPPIAAGILPLPPGTEATFLALWFAFAVGLSDQFRTGINTVTNGIVAMVFEALYPKYFQKGAAGLPEDAPAELVEQAS